MQPVDGAENQSGFCETTPLLSSSLPRRQALQESTCSRNPRRLRSTSSSRSNQYYTSDGDIDDEDTQSQFASSSHKDKSPVRLPPDKPSYTNGPQVNECRSSPLNDSLGSHSMAHPWSHFSEGVSLRLENSGSVARDHLASERTFLAYMRTSLAISASGVALVQLFSAATAASPQGSVHRLQHYVRPLGASTIFIGLLVLFIGVVRYFTVQAALTKGYFPVARIATGFIAVVLSALVTSTFAIMLAGKLEARSPRPNEYGLSGG